MTGIDCVVTHHLNPYRSGVARFNQVLADRLGVPVVGLDGDWAGTPHGTPLLSLKAGELDDREAAELEARLDRLGERRLRLFLHDFADLPLERKLLDRAELVYAANRELARRLDGHHPRIEDMWAPGLILDLRAFEPTDVSVFSFGMAHKVRTDMFEALRGLLERSGRRYALYMSHANHETASESDTELVHEQMRALFPERLYFLGTLSDVAVYNQLVSATFFAAFFDGGVRANNTSVASAMEHGAVVITNLDADSPAYLAHMDNVIDIEQADVLPDDPLVLRRLSLRAMETAREHSWERLLEQMDPLRASAQRGSGRHGASAQRGSGGHGASPLRGS